MSFSTASSHAVGSVNNAEFEARFLEIVRKHKEREELARQAAVNFKEKMEEIANALKADFSRDEAAKEERIRKFRSAPCGKCQGPREESTNSLLCKPCFENFQSTSQAHGCRQYDHRGPWIKWGVRDDKAMCINESHNPMLFCHSHNMGKGCINGNGTEDLTEFSMQDSLYCKRCTESNLGSRRNKKIMAKTRVIEIDNEVCCGGQCKLPECQQEAVDKKKFKMELNKVRATEKRAAAAKKRAFKRRNPFV